MLLLAIVELVFLRLSPAGEAKVWVYKIPGCDFEHYAHKKDPHLDVYSYKFIAEKSLTKKRHYPDVESAWPMHHRIANGPHVVPEPSQAKLFYIPAPFFIFPPAGCPVSYNTSEVKSKCFWKIKSHVEASGMFKRNHGRDHVILFGYMHYPAHCGFYYLPEEKHYALELAWPAFSNFLKVSIGSIAERTWVHAISGSTQQLMRAVTVPPILPRTDFECDRMLSLQSNDRQLRVTFHGLAYSDMPERLLIRRGLQTLSEELRPLLRHTALTFQNWSHVHSLDHGHCSPDKEFEGICVERRARKSKTRHYNMKTESARLAEMSELCLVMPGDGGFTLRLWTVMASGCIPVVISLDCASNPIMPFPHDLPWNDFAFFFDIARPLKALKTAAIEDGFPKGLVPSAQSLLLQLVALDKEKIASKRASLLQHFSSFSWDKLGACGLPQKFTAVELLLRDLARRIGSQPKKAYADLFFHKSGLVHLHKADYERNTNGCPLLFPSCKLVNISENATSYICLPLAASLASDLGYSCPDPCVHVKRRKWCWRQVSPTEYVPCSVSTCIGHEDSSSRLVKVRLAKAVPIVCHLHTSSLIKFVQNSFETLNLIHPGRYTIVAEATSLLDERDYHQTWNQLGLIRRTLIVGGNSFGYADFVVAVDESLAIAGASDGSSNLVGELDRFYDMASFHFLTEPSTLMLAPEDERDGNPSTALLAFRNHQTSVELINKLLRIGNARHPGTSVPLRRINCREAIVEYMRTRGKDGGILMLKPLVKQLAAISIA